MSDEIEFISETDPNVFIEATTGQEVKSIEINLQVIKSFFVTTIALYERLVKVSCKSCVFTRYEEFICLHNTLCEFGDLFKLFNISFDPQLLNKVAEINQKESQIVHHETEAINNDDAHITLPTKTWPCLIKSCKLKYSSEEASKVHFLKNHCDKSDFFELPEDEAPVTENCVDFSQTKKNKKGQYLCEYSDCTYASSDRSNFKVHSMRHLGNKKYTCQVCSKNFFTRDPLMIHFLRLHMKEVDWSLVSSDIRTLRKTIRRLTNKKYCHFKSNDDMSDSETDFTGPVSEDNAALNNFISQAINNSSNQEDELLNLKVVEDANSNDATDNVDEDGDNDSAGPKGPVNSFNVCLNLKESDYFSDSVTLKSEGATNELNDIITKSQDQNASFKATMSLSSTKDVMVNKEIKQRTKKYKCPHKFCEQDFFTKKNLLIHLKASHDPSNPIPCLEPGCSARFKSQALLAQHQKRHRVQYKCKVCQYKTHLAALMARHNRQHAGIYLHHECSICHEKFEYLGGLTSHRRKVHNEKEPLVCDWQNCDKRFKTIIGLNKHRREYHLNMRPEIACEWPDCNSVFSNRTAMTHHMRIHTNERPYQCTWQDCGKWFRLKETLKRHIKLHQGYKPHPCPFDNCDRAFVTKRNMKIHIEKVHLKQASSPVPIDDDTLE
ncbi:hypothetical protein RDWZM_003070 [Blomia tropicalis]|uniref:C2H2-type domain-containing protein n=1 Tax=Blomia tropicalis TaxID=40697 RepID=A0A9Q0MIW9_BLOTA|nr:hypothetical protein RDWZM_003070 [Blomia tropicalis]